MSTSNSRNRRGLLRLEPLEDRCVPATFSVMNVNDAGAGSFRQAILDANATPGKDRIDFVLASGGLETIALLTPLPDITEAVDVDATTLPAFQGSQTPAIFIDGSGLESGASGLVITSGNSRVAGLAIGGFQIEEKLLTGGAGIELRGGGSNQIENNFLGVTMQGTVSAPNTFGMLITDSNNNTIGGHSSLRNILSGNSITGIRIQGTAQGNDIVENFIGLGSNGAKPMSAKFLFNLFGVEIIDASKNKIRNNVISGHLGQGIKIEGKTQAALENIIDGNFIGTNATGNGLLGKVPGTGNGVGIVLLANEKTRITNNVISDNRSVGIRLEKSNEVVIDSNRIGTGKDGKTILGNGDGIILSDNGGFANDSNIISNNVISANFSDGITVESGSLNKIIDNKIGVTQDATTKLGNNGDGIRITKGDGNKLLGTNVISANGNDGISIGKDASNTQIGGSTQIGSLLINNKYVLGKAQNGKNAVNDEGMGTKFLQGAVLSGGPVYLAGTGAVVEQVIVALSHSDGVVIASSGNVLLGTIVTENAGAGIRIEAGIESQIRNASIFNNGGLGIDLVGGAEGAFGETANDLGDADAGPNNLQNAPMLTSISFAGGFTTVAGEIDSALTSSGYPITIEFFSNSAPDPSGFGEGETFLGSMTVSGPGSFVSPSFAGQHNFVTATATDAFGNTSEFSNSIDSTNPTISINDVFDIEGDSGAKVFAFTVRLSHGFSQPIAVQFDTQDGSAESPIDYLASTGMLTFNPGEITKTVEITVFGDTTFEPNESFFVNLSSPTNATILDSQGLGLILNDEPVSVTATLTADNHYGLLTGKSDGTDLNLEGRNEKGTAGDPSGLYNWSEPETFNFNTDFDDHLYVVAWDDDQWQMFLGEFNVGGSYQLLSDATHWEYTVVNQPNPGVNGDVPSLTDLATEIANANTNNAWQLPGATAPHSSPPSQWGTIPGITQDAFFVWHDTLDQISSSDSNYVIFRTVAPVNLNAPPTAVDDAASAVEDQLSPVTINVVSNDIDPENGPLTVISAGNQGLSDEGGAVRIFGNQIEYTPKEHFHGTDTFTYTIQDNNGWKSTATVTVTVASNNDDTTATITADNHYAVYVGKVDGSDMTFAGRNEKGEAGNPGQFNWSLPETIEFEPEAGDFIYVVAWDD